MNTLQSSLPTTKGHLMSDTARQSDEHTQNLLVRVLRECGEDNRIEHLSQLELIDCVLEKCMWDSGQSAEFMMRLLITVNCDKEVLSQRLLRSEEERDKLTQRVALLEETLQTSERDCAVQSHLLNVAHQHPGLEELRLFLVSQNKESLLQDLFLAGIDNIERLRVAEIGRAHV